jgi:hypothetical protein
MSQKESLTLAKDMIELQSKELGYSGKWLKAAENSVAVSPSLSLQEHPHQTY